MRPCEIEGVVAIESGKTPLLSEPPNESRDASNISGFPRHRV